MTNLLPLGIRGLIIHNNFVLVSNVPPFLEGGNRYKLFTEKLFTSAIFAIYQLLSCLASVASFIRMGFVIRSFCRCKCLLDSYKKWYKNFTH